MESILKVSDLNKSYGNFSLSNVSFSLPEGCITGFIGVNGAGKTTTLRTTMYANSEDFQVLAITTMVSSFVAE